MARDVIFEPLNLGALTIKNRILRSNMSGRWDNEDGSGTQTRINWETKFARGGIGGIISSYVPVTMHGRIMPNYATVHTDDYIPFWRKLGEARSSVRLQIHHAAQPFRPAAGSCPGVAQ